MIKISTDLFDFAKGIKEPPSDSAHVEAIRAEFAAATSKLATCDPEAKLAVARFIAKGLNGTTREFNVAVFVVDKQESTAELPLEQPLAQEVEL